MAAAVINTNVFEPESDLIQENECDTLLLHLPGFSKEQLRVQLAKAGVLKISGKRLLNDNKWSIFEKDFPVSSNCDTKKISAKFEGGILYVRQPKLIVQEVKEEVKVPPPSVFPQLQKPVNEPPPAPKKDQEQINYQKATKNDEQLKQTSAKEFPDKSVQKEELKNTRVNEKNNEPESAKTGEKNSSKEKKGSKADELKSALKSSVEKLGNVEEATRQNLIEKAEGAKLNGEIPAAKLKVAKKIMNKILVALLAFALGLYARDLIWRSEKP